MEWRPGIAEIASSLCERAPESRARQSAKMTPVSRQSAGDPKKSGVHELAMRIVSSALAR